MGHKDLALTTRERITKDKKKNTALRARGAHNATESAMHTNPVKHTTLIFAISNPPTGTAAFFIDWCKIHGGMASVMAQQHTPPTRPSTVPKLGTLHASKAAKTTNAERMPRDAGVETSAALPLAAFCARGMIPRRVDARKVGGKEN